MQMEIFNDIREFARKNSRKSWFKEAKKAWDNKDIVGTKKVLREVEEVQELLYKYNKGNQTTVTKATRTQLQVLFYPKQSCVCKVCGKGYLEYTQDWRWQTGCSRKCAAKSSEVRGKAKDTMLERYGVENPSHSTKIKKKRERTIVKRYGVKNAFQSKELMEKAAKTIRKRYGVNNVSQSEEIKQRKEDTSVLRCGHSHWTRDPNQYEKLTPFTKESLDKARVTMMERYGVDNPFKSKKVQKRIKKTLLERYGVENIFMSEGFAEKAIETCIKNHGKAPWEMSNAFRVKRYVDLNGDVHNVQGHEPWALGWLESRPYKVRVVTGSSKVPVIRYNLNGEGHRFYPDIVAYTKSTKKVIEVKSDFTLFKLEGVWEKNLAKFRAANKYCKKHGFEFWLFIFAGGRFIRIKEPTSAKIRKELGF